MFPFGGYYHFRVKDDLVRAVIDARAEQAAAMLGSLQALSKPGARLKALTQQWVEMRELVARSGCPFGTLAAELDRREDGLDTEAARPIALILDWIEQQFREIGHADPRELAICLLPESRAPRCWPTPSATPTS